MFCKAVVLKKGIQSTEHLLMKVSFQTLLISFFPQTLKILEVENNILWKWKKNLSSKCVPYTVWFSSPIKPLQYIIGLRKTIFIHLFLPIHFVSDC